MICRFPSSGLDASTRSDVGRVFYCQLETDLTGMKRKPDAGQRTLFIAEMLFSARSSTSQTKNQAGQFLDPGRRLSL